ncbi:vanadium-dependent haloperoxidase [Lysobacter niastensis]|uniref:Phosphatase PAP2 family protein n=1 Tax=Lysobacter niastensis TaxID=380629 RepID=A0ABS0B6S7_9GAMM|nr:vanadium-dependent haloperoxidase [Lysobacter niastensis]MBF6024593.1 phosphatase PAP2 family protein [Lysobacter niastensis]
MKSPFASRVPHHLLAGAIALALPGTALADAVTDWNALTTQFGVAAGGPPQQFRVAAMAQIAVHDALNSIDPRYRTYAPLGAANPNASPDAAVARATADVLLATVPSQSAAINTAYSNYIAALPACPVSAPTCIADGEAAGAAAAAAIVEMRTLDGSETPHVPYTLAPGRGVYQPTTPTPAPPAPFPQFGGWGDVKPFALGSHSQFGSGRTDFFNLKGKTYTADYNEVKSVGSSAVRGAAPDSEESQIARFWPGGGGNLNAVARTIVNGMGLDLWEHARLFALTNIAINDALVVTFHLKFRYNFWRPQTAIRYADDGNPNTDSDPNWSSYLTTPPYPDYPCGLPSTVGAATEVWRDFFGTDEVPFTFTATALPPSVTRSYTSLSQAAAESASARVYAGIHFRSGCEAAVRQSEKVGRFVTNTQLKGR